MRAARVAAVLAAILVLAVLAGMLVPRPLLPAEAATTPGTRVVLVLSNPIHTDIAFPAEADVVARLGFVGEHGLAPDAEGVVWVLFGWGGRAFYLETPQWADLRPGPVLRAFTLDDSVMHVGLAGPIGADEPDVVALRMTDARLHAMLDAVLGSFERSAAGDPIPIVGSGYGAYDLFYEARGRFNALSGCNLWTAAMLRAGGFRVGPWTPLPVTLTASLRLHNDLAGH